MCPARWRVAAQDISPGRELIAVTAPRNGATSLRSALPVCLSGTALPPVVQDYCNFPRISFGQITSPVRLNPSAGMWAPRQGTSLISSRTSDRSGDPLVMILRYELSNGGVHMGTVVHLRSNSTAVERTASVHRGRAAVHRHGDVALQVADPAARRPGDAEQFRGPRRWYAGHLRTDAAERSCRGRPRSRLPLRARFS